MQTATTIPETSTACLPSVMNWRRRLGRTVFLLCGLLLLGAAGLKLYGMNVAPFAQYGWLLTPTVQAVALVWEVLLGIRLVSSSMGQTSKPASSHAWIAAVLTFTTFAIVSGYLGVIGQANCGCFGAIDTSPWTAFAVDVLAVALLALGRPVRPLRDEWAFQNAKRTALGFGGVAILLAAVAGVGTAQYGSLDAAMAKLRGESLGVSPTVLEFGSGQPGDLLTAAAIIRNYTDKPVQLIGGTSDCSCIATQDMPVTIEPGGQTVIRIQLKVPVSTSGVMVRWVDLLTNYENQPRVRLKAECRVRD